MIPDNVTLIVKAPNQQVEDQNIECRSSWTVKQLKGHLSEVYPSKPRTDDQKIIYSGQLLDDNTILKDVLRTYETTIAHTMHLVCTPTRKMASPLPQDKVEVEPTEGLRHRNVPEPTRPVEARPETRQNDQNHTVEMQNYLTSLTNNYGRPNFMNYNMADGQIPGDVTSQVNQMMMMQQAYLEYLRQYTNMLQSYNDNQPHAPVPETPGPAEQAPPPAEEEGGAVGRDWLDHLYAGSRLAILFSLVYLYGSPARLLLVALLVTAGYLHQIGFFRELQLNPGGNQPANDRPEEADRPPRPADADRREPTTDDNRQHEPTTDDNRQQERSADDDRRARGTDQSLLAAARVIVMSFFASLIPDVNY